MKPILKASLFLVVAGAMLPGCGDSGGKPEPMANEQQVQNMVKARDIFDASTDKNFDTLAADKKAEYSKLVGAKDEAAAKKWWDTMAHPAGIGSGPTTG